MNTGIVRRQDDNGNTFPAQGIKPGDLVFFPRDEQERLMR
jgi:hypothetical protein